MNKKISFSDGYRIYICIAKPRSIYFQGSERRQVFIRKLRCTVPRKHLLTLVESCNITNEVQFVRIRGYSMSETIFINSNFYLLSSGTNWKASPIYEFETLFASDNSRETWTIARKNLWRYGTVRWLMMSEISSVTIKTLKISERILIEFHLTLISTEL